MSQQDNFDRIVSALHDAALDDTVWPSASTLIDEAVGMVGTHLMILSGQTYADLEVLFESLIYRSVELDQEYTQQYFPHDERVPRFLRLPDSRLVHVPTLYTEQEWKTSPTPNEPLATLSWSQRFERAAGRPGGLLHRLGLNRPSRPQRLALRTDHVHHPAAASHSSVHPSPAGVSRRRSAPHLADTIAR